MNIVDFSHNSKLDDNEPDWGSVDKTKLPRVAFADRGEPDKKSTWGYPHHWVKGGSKTDESGVYTDGTLYLHRGGLAAAWSAANGGRSGQEASPAVKAHLNVHRNAIGMGDEDKKRPQGAGMIQSYRSVKNAEAVARFWGKSLDKPDWYSVKGMSEDEGEIMIYDIIGWPYNDATELVRAIRGFTGKSLMVRINSPGGDVFDGTAIFNALANHSAKVTTRVEGVAASMASALAMAGKEVQAYSNTMMMIHDPWVIAMGNQYSLREIADLLEKLGGNLVDIYTGKTKTGKKEMKQMMANETWMTAKEAEEKGFVDTVLTSGKAAKAQFDLSVFANAPDGLSMEREGKELDEREIERALRDAGASRSFAKAVVADRFKTLRDAGLNAEAQLLCRTIKKLTGGKEHEC